MSAATLELSLEAGAAGRLFAAGAADPSRLHDAPGFSQHRGSDFRRPAWLSPEVLAFLIGAFDWRLVEEALQTESEHFIDRLRQGTTPISSSSTGLRVVEIVEATSCSIAAQGTPIEPQHKFGKRGV